MDDLAGRTMKQVFWRVLPVILVGHFLMHLDRSNVGYAALEMNKDLGLTPAMFGFGVGIFFWGYAALEIPSNLALQRFGARLWIGRIIVTWGLLAAALAFSYDKYSFYGFRFLLGCAEAGFTPGSLLYLSRWFPRQQRATATSIYISIGSVAAVIGGILGGWLISLSVFGLKGWQTLFVLEGLGTVVFGLVLMAVLPEEPTRVRWLASAGREWLTETLQREAEEKQGQADRVNFLASIKAWPVWIYGATYCCIVISFLTLYYWLPQVIKENASNLSNLQVGLVSAIPHILAVLCTIAFGRMSDATGDRRWHLIGLSAIGGVCLLLSVQVASPIVGFALLCVAIASCSAYMGIFWSAPSTILGGTAAAGGLALISSIGTFGGFIGPYLFGVIRQLAGQFETAIASFSLFFIPMLLIPLLCRGLFSPVPGVRLLQEGAGIAGTRSSASGDIRR